MVDLSTLDDNSPRDSEPVALGDDAIRQTREAIKTTIGLEHDLVNGIHRIPVGTTSARPPAGKEGRLYGNSEVSRIEYDTGAEWKVTSLYTSALLNVWQLPITNIPTNVFEQIFATASTVIVMGQFRIDAAIPIGTYAVMEIILNPTPAAYFVSQVYNKEFDGATFYTVPVLLCRENVTAMQINLWLNPAATTNAYLQGMVMVK